ncbi:MAG: hypothetical protein ACTSRG_22930 [Candidatus Helarchaeota archaeon]
MIHNEKTNTCDEKPNTHNEKTNTHIEEININLKECEENINEINDILIDTKDENMIKNYEFVRLKLQELIDGYLIEIDDINNGYKIIKSGNKKRTNQIHAKPGTKEYSRNYSKIYYSENKDKYRRNQRIYNEKNKEKLKRYSKEYYDKNRKEIIAKIKRKKIERDVKEYEKKINYIKEHGYGDQYLKFSRNKITRLYNNLRKEEKEKNKIK